MLEGALAAITRELQELGQKRFKLKNRMGVGGASL